MGKPGSAGARRVVALASVPRLLEDAALLKRPEHLAARGRTEAVTGASRDALPLCYRPVDLLRPMDRPIYWPSWPKIGRNPNM